MCQDKNLCFSIMLINILLASNALSHPVSVENVEDLFLVQQLDKIIDVLVFASNSVTLSLMMRVLLTLPW